MRKQLRKYENTAPLSLALKGWNTNLLLGQSKYLLFEVGAAACLN